MRKDENAQKCMIFIDFLVQRKISQEYVEKQREKDNLKKKKEDEQARHDALMRAPAVYGTLHTKSMYEMQRRIFRESGNKDAQKHALPSADVCLEFVLGLGCVFWLRKLYDCQSLKREKSVYFLGIGKNWESEQ